MESQPQNPEFSNNPENFHPCLISKHAPISAHWLLHELFTQYGLLISGQSCHVEAS